MPSPGEASPEGRTAAVWNGDRTCPRGHKQALTQKWGGWGSQSLSTALLWLRLEKILFHATKANSDTYRRNYERKCIRSCFSQQKLCVYLCVCVHLGNIFIRNRLGCGLWSMWRAFSATFRMLPEQWFHPASGCVRGGCQMKDQLWEGPVHSAANTHGSYVCQLQAFNFQSWIFSC